MSKIISGVFKGIELEVFPQKNMRPTSCRAKEALFNIIQFDLKNKIFVDLFAGTGQIGLEALSRGASKCFFVEKSRISAKILIKNINKILKIKNQKLNFEIYKLDINKFLDKFSEKTDILFADAPFDAPIEKEIFVKFSRIMNKNGILIIENEYKNNPINNLNLDYFYFIKRYTYGRISFDFYKNNL